MQRKREARSWGIWKRDTQLPIDLGSTATQWNGKKPFFISEDENPGQPTAQPSKGKSDWIIENIANDYDKSVQSLQSSNLPENQKWQNRLKRKQLWFLKD